MSKLKKLSKEDLNVISDFFLSTLDDKLFKIIGSKEITDLDLDVLIDYDNEKLDVNLDFDIFLDLLSDMDSDKLQQAIDSSYEELDAFIENNYKE